VYDPIWQVRLRNSEMGSCEELYSHTFKRVVFLLCTKRVVGKRQAQRCDVCCADVGARPSYDVSESCASNRRDVRSAVPAHLRPLQRRLLAHLLTSLTPVTAERNC